MIRVLVVEDSKIISSSLKDLIVNSLGFSCLVAESMKEASILLLKFKGKFDVALLDLGLPDAPKGEIVDLVTKFSIPTIILTGSNLDADEEKFRNKSIVDYVIKDGSYSIKYAVSVVDRIVRNNKVKVMVVDDSKSACDKLCKLLERYKITAISAYSAEESLNILKEQNDIKIIFIDYLMPNMNGLELTREIRKTFPKDKLSLIAVSGESNRKIISKFLKYGANDFIYKGFTEEEFFIRLNNELETLELYEQI